MGYHVYWLIGGELKYGSPNQFVAECLDTNVGVQSAKRIREWIDRRRKIIGQASDEAHMYSHELDQLERWEKVLRGNGDWA